MPVVGRSELKPLHDVVLNAWREIIHRSATLGWADRIVVATQLEARAKALALHEGLANESGDLSADTRAFALSVKQSNPVSSVRAAIGIAAGVLGFFGVAFFDLLPELGTIERGVNRWNEGTDRVFKTIAGILTLAGGSAVVMLVRFAYVVAANAGKALTETLTDFTSKEHASATLLKEAWPAEVQLFSLFKQPVPQVPVSTAPLVLLGIVFLLIGVFFALVLLAGQ